MSEWYSGWQCPRCGSIWSPFVARCDCRSEKSWPIHVPEDMPESVVEKLWTPIVICRKVKKADDVSYRIQHP